MFLGSALRPIRIVSAVCCVLSLILCVRSILVGDVFSIFEYLPTLPSLPPQLTYYFGLTLFFAALAVVSALIFWLVHAILKNKS